MTAPVQSGEFETHLSVGLYPNLPVSHLVTLAMQADAAGFYTAWIPDSHLLWREAYVSMGAIAQMTSTIRLGTAVTNPLTRRLTVTASAMSTLAELSGSRAVLGLGVGDSALRTEGLQPATVSRLREDISTVRALMSGDVAELVEGTPVELAYIDGSLTVPVYVAATGPRMLDMAGRIADGVILMNGVSPHLISAAIQKVHLGADAVGRDPTSVKIVVWAACCISNEQPERAVNAVKYNVARAVLRKVPGLESYELQNLIEQLKKSYDYRGHGSSAASFAQWVPDELVRDFAFAGTSNEVTEQVSSLAALGVDEVAFALPNAAGDLDQPHTLRRLTELKLELEGRSNTIHAHDAVNPTGTLPR